jgi:hypothetical protein
MEKIQKHCAKQYNFISPLPPSASMACSGTSLFLLYFFMGVNMGLTIVGSNLSGINTFKILRNFCHESKIDFEYEGAILKV